MNIYSFVAVSISGSGKAIIELDGDNTLRSFADHAGIEKAEYCSLEIGGNGSLTVTGGEYGAGIGGGNMASGSNITITGGTITATGGDAGAGIGGGCGGSGSDIKITGGTVTATGGQFGAGIGGGEGKSGSNITIAGGTITATSLFNGAGIGEGAFTENSNIPNIKISGSARVNVAGGAAENVFGAGAAIGEGGKSNNVNGDELPPDTSALYVTGFIKYFEAGTTITDMKNETGVLLNTITGTVPEPSPSQPETPSEEPAYNKPGAVSTETRGNIKITYPHLLPFYGNGEVTPKYFGEITVSQGNATYKATKIKVNKKKHMFQITGLSGADKDTVKKIKKATKGSSRLPFRCNPYYVRDTDRVTPKFKKSGDLKSVKIWINNKYYKAKKDEFSYDSSKKLILFKGKNLNGSYTSK